MMMIIIICILCILFLFDNQTEHYDASIKDIDLSDCFKICKTSSNCLGIGFNKNKKTCYLSKKKISNEGQPFYKEYNPKNIYCKKFLDMSVSNYTDKNSRLYGSLFKCKRNRNYDSLSECLVYKLSYFF
jgi:hypothetical protein